MNRLRILLIVCTLAAPVSAATFVVTNTADSGPGSLRQAILDANSTPAFDTITFSIGSGMQTIEPHTDLPNITAPLGVDGSTQPGYSGKPLITISELYNPGGKTGLRFNDTAAVNAIAIGGIRDDSSITHAAIEFWGANSYIINSYIGVAADGVTALTNSIGIHLDGGGSNPNVSNCFLVYNTFRDIDVGGAPALIQGNHLGMTPLNHVVSSSSEGIIVWQSAFGTGQSATVVNNVVAGFQYGGIIAVTPNVIIKGNKVGFDLNGQPSSVPVSIGMEISGANCVVGGPSPSDANVITGAQTGLYLLGPGALVEQNEIYGASTGIDVTSSGTSTIIGSTTPGLGNYIHDNLEAIAIRTGVANSILGNRITHNSLTSVFIDPSANEGQRPPSLASVSSIGGHTRFIGTFSSKPGRAVRIEFFRNAACHSSGSGEGDIFLGYYDVTADGSGNGTFDVTLTVDVPPGSAVTAIATDAKGNSSPFSACTTSAGAGTLRFSTSAYTVAENGANAVVAVQRLNGTAGSVSVSFATSNGTATSGVDYTATAGTLSFADGESAKPILIPIIDNSVTNPVRTFNIALSNPNGGATLASPSSATVTIQDNEIPTLSVDDISVPEGNSGMRVANFTITLSGPLNTGTTVFYRFEAGSARLGADYSASASSVFFAPGDVTKTVPVQIIGDTDVEPNETFSIVLSSTTPISKSRGTCTIINDDSGIGPSPLSVAKGAKGKLFVFLGSNAQSASNTITLTSSNTAIATVSPSVPLPASTTTAEIEVTGVSVGTAQITATLPASFGGASLVANVQVFTPATMTFTPSVLSLVAGTSRSVTVTLDPPPASPIDLHAMTNDSSVARVPATITMSASGTATLTVDGKAKGSTLVGVTMPADNGGADQFFSVQVTDTPTGPFIAQVSPATGPIAGGTNVVIAGQNLASACTFTFGGSLATNTTFVSTSSVTATTPAHSAGPVDVMVSCGADQYTLPGAFTYIAAAPQLSGVSPTFGSVSGGTAVVVSGSNLRSTCGVFFDAMMSKILSATLPDRIIVETPMHAPGAANVSIRCGDATATLKSAFTYNAADDPSASISDIDPLGASVGQRITIKGARFRTSDVIAFGDARATPISTTPDTHVVDVPSVPVGKIAINLTDINGRLITTGPIFNIFEPVTPQITSVTPSKTAPGGEVVIEGRGFRAPYTFALDGKKALSVVDLSFTRAIVRVAPDTPPSTYAVNVINADGLIASGGASIDIVTSVLAITNVTPQCARADGGAEITISGNGFTPDARVTVGGATATNVRVISANVIKANVPEGALGWGDVVVSNPNGDSSTLARAFFYYSPYDNSGGCTTSRTRGTRH